MIIISFFDIFNQCPETPVSMTLKLIVNLSIVYNCGLVSRGLGGDGDSHYFMVSN